MQFNTGYEQKGVATSVAGTSGNNSAINRNQISPVPDSLFNDHVFSVTRFGDYPHLSKSPDTHYRYTLRKDRMAMKSNVMLVCMYILPYIPAVIAPATASRFNSDAKFDDMFALCISISFISNMSNAYVYAYWNTTLRNDIRKMFQCINRRVTNLEMSRI